ncbi:hypothetical protein L227DRAFT_501370 [Lentinus tigrinus ALCF2SS1-6]|uniref:F-box domain-containing protein n=1 Tax=Lentinus tigrinus ALCF2SS1-6 TaxID=1328759 RepID=A0A5C2SCB7_9APHY|nr:hypothetical protein L227DRAFT_501370 [Lentinus tigrinus ALCF2SS1-6]
MSDRTLVLTTGLPESENVEDVLTAGNISLASIPHFGPLVAALMTVGASHKPVNVRYRPDAPFVPSYTDCLLQDVSQLPLLQYLASIPTLVTLQLQLPVFGLETLPPLDAPHLTTLIVRGELPCIYQLLHAIRAPALEKLKITFHRNQWDKLDTLDGSLRDAAYTLALAPTSFPALRTVQVEENEPCPRWSDVSFGCAFRPLMHIPTLEDVEVQLDASPLWVSFDDLARVALVWPELRRLVLTCSRASKRAPTLDALSHVEAACRNLVELVLPKIRMQEPDAVAVQMQPYSLNPSLGHHPLRTLRLTCQTSATAATEYCVEVGRRIEHLFPNLQPEDEFMYTMDLAALSDWDAIRMGIMEAKAMRNPFMLSML